MLITAIETILPGPDSSMPALTFVRVHTDEGLIGHGETYYAPRSVSTYIHEFLAPLLLGEDALAPERHWERAYRSAARFGTKGVEMRALSAVDLALWDLLGQAAGLPVYRLLGGPVRPDVTMYNTCGGPRYSRGSGPGHGDASVSGSYDDFDAFLHRPAELAAELIEDGFVGMKIWPFDPIAIAHGGESITSDNLRAGLDPIRLIRESVGTTIDVMVEGHGFWSLPTAKRIARSLEPYEPAWIEDFLLADDPTAIAELKGSTSLSVLAGEYLMTRFEFRPMLEARATDYLMIDPTWCGGITESRKIANMADTWRVPVTMHDCTGPFTLLAGIHLSLSLPNAWHQEVVRAFLHVNYPDYLDDFITITNGRIQPPERPGIGAALRPDVADRPGTERYWSRSEGVTGTS